MYVVCYAAIFTTFTPQATDSLIELDLPRTFPALSFFQKGGPYNSNLIEVIRMFVSSRPDIGYVCPLSFQSAYMHARMRSA